MKIQANREASGAGLRMVGLAVEWNKFNRMSDREQQRKEPERIIREDER